MQLYTNNVQDRYGNALKGASITVRTDAGALATIYSDNGVTPASNPLTADSTGEFAFYAANGRYTFTVSATGMLAETVINFELADSLEVVAAATGGAATATAKAAEALASANAAAGSASTAADKATIATAQATIATDKAALTAADRIQTGLDRTAASDSAAAALASSAIAATGATTAAAKAADAETARAAAVVAQNNAVAVVTGGTGSLIAAPGKLPLADATGTLDMTWFSPLIALQTKLRIALANRISGATIVDVRLVPFEIERVTVINRINGYCEVTDTTGKLVEVAIYSAAYAKLASSEVREIPFAGDFQFAIPETTLPRGRYYFGICTNSTTAQFSVNAYAGAISATAAFPAPTTAAAPTPTAVAVSATLLEKDLPVTQGLFSHTDGRPVRVYGVDPATAQPYGWNTATGRIAKSVDSGATWVDLMLLPNTGANTMNDLVVSGGKIYAFTSGCTLFESSDLTSGATWTDISCPTTAGLRHPAAIGRPYGIAAWQGNIFIGEYSATGGEFAPDGPRVLRFDVTTRVWALSKEFPAARHVHSFYTGGSSTLWVSLGDAGYGADVGIHRLTPANMGTGAGGTDVWTRWTSNASPNTNHYPVDFMEVGTANTFNGETSVIGLYGTSDRPGKHLLYCKQSGVAGAFNLSAQVFQRPGGVSSETVRSIVYDPVNKNLYYWTAETTEQALYISPPPYTQAVKLKDYPASPTLFLSRAVYSGGYIMIFDQRFSVEKFAGQ